ncbi:hypothetical protein LCGC14_1985020 [marine sediment metagenome]|uniref:Uncharacterized protein n=1 Tax=marine sediment metagenome TaxID=412755 RepID=A0A0F9I4V2_9ZZZZ
MSKFDLSSDRVVLDYQELLEVALSAQGYAIKAVSERMDTIRKGHPSNIEGEWLLNDTHRLVKALTAVYYLTRGLDRPVINVVREDN